MSTTLYVGNLSLNTIEDEIEDLFAQHGPVYKVYIITDTMSGRARGFAFVTMSTKEAADAAHVALDGKEWEGRYLTVIKARPRKYRPLTAAEAIPIAINHSSGQISCHPGLENT